MNDGKKKKRIITLIVIAILLALWFIVSSLGVFSEYVFPGPVKVFNTFVAMIKSGELFENILVSMARVLAGFLISFVLAFIVAIIAVLYPQTEDWYQPVLNFLRHVPPLSMIPLLILWFGIGETSKIIVIVLTAFFPIFINTEAGLKNCDVKLIEVGQILEMTRNEIFFKIQLPSAIPEILVGMKIGLGYSFRAIVGAEMIAAASGIGFLILDAQAMSRTDKVFIGIITIGTLGLIFDALFAGLIRKINFSGEKLHE